MSDYIAAYFDSPKRVLFLRKGAKTEYFTRAELMKEAKKSEKKGGLSRSYWTAIWNVAESKPDRWIVVG